ncbi:MAG: LacI family DNA-binding transcriptional regulator [Bacilli bacterium]
MTITIKDVARLANVAPSTVSRVIADSSRISEATKRKVKKAMEELGYHPNFNARSLANRTTQSLGIVMPSSASKSFANPFFPEVIRGISSYARTEEYNLYLTTGESEEEILDDVIKMVQGKRVDGLIVLYSRENDPVLDYLVDTKFPFVLIGKPHHPSARIPYIDNDNYRASRELTDYVIGLGHKHIAFVGGSLAYVVTQDRLRGYEDAIRLAGGAVESDWVQLFDFDRDGGEAAISALLSSGRMPSAIVVTDDMMALGVLKVLNEKSVRVPEDVSIVSFNNFIVSEYTTPPLTTVDVNIYQLGYEACRMLVEHAQNDDFVPKSILIPTTLIERASCTVLKNR